MDFSNNIGANIKKERTKKGYSQDYLGGLCDIANTAISNYENGKKNPSLDTIAIIAKRLDISIDQLYYGDESVSFISSETKESRKIVNAIYYLWLADVISINNPYDISSKHSKNNECTPDLFSLTLNKYFDEIRRLLLQLEDYKQHIDTYANPDEQLENILSSAAASITKAEEEALKREAQREAVRRNMQF